MKEIPPPSIVNVCVVRGICPASCKHCPVGLAIPTKRNGKFGYGFATVDQFERLCDEIIDLGTPVPVLRIHGIGEPTMWSELGEALRICSEKGVNTWLFTIGFGANNAEFIDTVKRASIIEFSINAFTREDFSRTKGISKEIFDTIVCNIQYLSSLKQEKGAAQRILVSRVQTEDKVKDRSFVDFWLASGFVDDAFIRSFHDYGGRISDKDSLLSSSKVKGCLVPTARMNVDAVLGLVVRCFNELFAPPEQIDRIAIAPLFDNFTLREIWTGLEMSKWREDTFAYSECSGCRSCQPPYSNTSEKQIKNLNMFHDGGE